LIRAQPRDLTPDTGALLDVRGLRIAIPGRDGERVAVANIDFEVNRGEVLGLVGESGSGKSLSMLAVMGLLPPNMQVSGSVRFQGREILGLPEWRMRRLRGGRIAMIFQDPMTALNPVLTIGSQVAEALALHNPGLSRKALRHRAPGTGRDPGAGAAVRPVSA
jgi:ABC-type microcin C transport system duplicated ATPase subunit YejF